jgi:hypothetical protein
MIVAARRIRPRRLPATDRPRRASLLDAVERRERIAALVGEATIEAAFAERQFVEELPASIWRQLLSTVDKLSRLSWPKRIEFCAAQSELMRRLLVLLVLDPRATVKSMHAKLG